MYLTSSATSRKLIGTNTRPLPLTPNKAVKQSSRVVADDGDPLADADPHGVERCRLGPGSRGHIGVCDGAPRLRRLCRFVDDRVAMRIDLLGASEEIVDGECDLHAGIVADPTTQARTVR